MPHPIDVPNIHKETMIEGQAKSRNSLVQLRSKRSPINAPIVTLLKKETASVGNATFSPNGHIKATAKRGPNIEGAGKRSRKKSHAPAPPIPNRNSNPNSSRVDIPGAPFCEHYQSKAISELRVLSSDTTRAFGISNLAMATMTLIPAIVPFVRCPPNVATVSFITVEAAKWACTSTSSDPSRGAIQPLSDSNSKGCSSVR